MELRVVLKRSFEIICLSTLISCAVQSTEPQSAENESLKIPTQPVNTSAVQTPPSSRILSSLTDGNVGIELLEDGKSDQLIINADAQAGDFIVNRISDPERIVIDVKGKSGRLNKNFDASDTAFLTAVRVGSHPDKTRIVLDLPAGRDIEHAVETEAGKLKVSLSEIGGQAEQSLNLAMTAPVLPTSESDELDEIAVESEPEGLVEVNEEYDTTVKSVSIEELGGEGNVMVAEVSAPGIYTLNQTAPSEYVLTIDNAKVEAEQTAMVAPPQSGLIRSVRAVQEGDKAVLRIFAQPDSKLSARAGEDKIVVSAISEQSDYKAQAETADVPAADDSVAKPASPEVTAVEDSENGDSFEQQLDALASSQYSGRLISLDLQDTDIDNALRIIAEVSNLNIIASDDVTGKVTLRLIDVPWDQALDVILKTNGLDKVREGNVIRIAPVEKLRQEREALKQLRVSQEELEPLQVKYIRISYAKASELKALVETVVSERGVVTYDERSNQLIIKDIGVGIKNVSELVSRVDLRTPQVLLETQIVEANRRMERDLGAELGFQYIQSAATGNPTGLNFPNSIGIQGSDTSGENQFSSFPAAAGSAISFLLGSADGSKNLDLRLSALETEGRVRVISRPAVATTNNKQATIKSVEKIRVKTPQGGLSVATGQGASASGSSSIATEAIEIGIVLEVTPQASPDYYVLLDINAKSSTLGAQLVEGIPSEIERSATSTVLVSSGQTFAMGGIYKISDNDNVTGVPFLKDIPFLGHFFRRAGVVNSDEELLFFITPRIVEGSFDDATMKFTS